MSEVRDEPPADPRAVDVAAAAARLADVARRTAIFDDPRLDEALGIPMLIKAEHLQRSGSFKFRGIYNKIASLDVGDRSRGVITVSSGNAGAAAALAARLMDARCTVVVPNEAVETKLKRIAGYGAELVRGGTTIAAVMATAEQLTRKHGMAWIHPFDQPEVVAGAATIGMEILEQVGAVDDVVVQTSGGGMLAGISLVLRAALPEVRITGVQPRSADAIRQSIASGFPVETSPAAVDTIADGLIATAGGRLTTRIISENVDDVVVVDDESVASAMRLLWTSSGLAVEPSAAAGLAALLEHPHLRRGRTLIVTSGGNFDPALLHHVTAGGTAASWKARTA